MFRLKLFIAVAVVSTGVSLRAHAQQTVAVDRPLAAATAAALHPGDAVKLRIWREPDLSGEFQVDENGEIVFPKIGAVHVTGMSTDSLKNLLVTTYSSVLRDPSIDVTFLRRVTVSGFVQKPGLYQVDPTVKISDVLALAGGAAPDGDANKVELMRNGRVSTEQVSVGTRLGDSPLRSGDQLYVPQRSWLSRNVGLVATVVSSAALIVATIVRN